MPKAPQTQLVLLVTILLIVAGLVSVSNFLYSQYQRSMSTSQTTFPQFNPNPYNVTLIDFALCASNCVYPDPYLSGIVLVHSNVGIASLHLFINGTDEGFLSVPTVLTTTVPPGGTLTYGIMVKAQPTNPAMPIKAGNTYVVTVEATFTDNLTSTASTLVTAT